MPNLTNITFLPYILQVLHVLNHAKCVSLKPAFLFYMFPMCPCQHMKI